jgi:Domain of unknown function (DUF4189)
MWSIRIVVKSTPAVIAAAGIACASLPSTSAAEGLSYGLVVAQTSMEGSKAMEGATKTPPPPPLAPLPLPPPQAPVPPPLNLPAPSAPPPLNLPAPSTPKADYIPPSLAPTPPQEEPGSSGNGLWGAIGFTADGSYSSVWKMASKAEAEAEVAKKCASFGRGSCEVVSFSGHECAALATFIGNYQRRRWDLSFTEGGNTYPGAQNAAMTRCNSDERTQGRCQLRTAVCADGR